MMIIFNLLPIYPLDGYRLYYFLLSKIYDDEFTYGVLFNLSVFSICLLGLTFFFTKSLAILIIILFLLTKLGENHFNHQRREKNKKILLVNYFKNLNK